MPRAPKAFEMQDPHSLAGKREGNLEIAIGREVRDGSDLARLDAGQILPNLRDDRIDLAEDDLERRVTQCVAGGACERFYDRSVLRRGVVLDSVAPLAAIVPEERAERGAGIRSRRSLRTEREVIEKAKLRRVIHGANGSR